MISVAVYLPYIIYTSKKQVKIKKTLRKQETSYSLFLESNEKSLGDGRLVGL